jgi:hypothetical protein
VSPNKQQIERNLVMFNQTFSERSRFRTTRNWKKLPQSIDHLIDFDRGSGQAFGPVCRRASRPPAADVEKMQVLTGGILECST